MGKHSRHGLAALALAAGTLSGAGAQAAGFALIEHSAQGMGNVFAGGAANAEDLSTIQFNAAGITRLEGTQAQAGGHVIFPKFDFSDTGSFQATTTPGVTLPLLPGADRNEDGATIGIVPNLYYVRDLTPEWKFGFGVNVPFGLKTEYDRSWVGRYQAVESDIVTFNINPTLAYQVTDRLSVGAGLDVMYMKATLSNAIDFDAVCNTTAPLVAAGAMLPGVPAGTCALPGSGTSDGFVENEADGWAFGLNFGILYQITDSTRVGLAYRTEVQQELDGDADFTVPASVASGPLGATINGLTATTFADTGVKADVDLPAMFSASLYHAINPKLAVMLDATWTGWSSIQELRIRFDSSVPDGVETLRWEDTWRVAAGLAYYHSPRLTLRTGVAYDESPIPSAQMRTARLPDNNRVWLGVGASYRLNDRLTADFGYSHLFIDDTKINRTGSSGSVLRGTYDSDSNIISAQVRYRFK